MAEQIDPDALLLAAWKAREMAHAPYSKFAVGAAIQTTSGRVFTGCNVENISFGLTLCAERAAVAAAVQHGEKCILAIAVVAVTAVPIVPCGACRQFLAEFNPDMVVHSEGDCQLRAEWNLAYLLPQPSDGILDLGRI